MTRVVYVWGFLVAPLIYGFAFPLHGWAWPAWIGLVPWCVAQRIAPTRLALAVCWVSTLVGSYLCTPWLAPAVANYYQQPLLLGILLFAGIWIVTIGPYVTAFTLCYRRMARRPSVFLPLLAGMAWAGAEMGRVRLFIGEPFGVFGYSQLDFRPVAQIADLTGVYGMSALLIAVNAALAELWLACSPTLLRSLPIGTGVLKPRQARSALGLVAATIVGCALYGVIRIHQFGDTAAPTATRISIVQANIDLGSQWRQEFYGRNLEDYMRLTVDTLRQHRPQLVFWPESSMTFFLDEEPSYRSAIGHLLSPSQTQLVAGGAREVGQPNAHYFNSAFLIAPDGSILQKYDKQKLLPFAEYFPFGGIALLKREFGRVREFTPGGPAELLPTVAGLAGVVICNEVMFGEIAAERVRHGANFLATLTNDAWLGDRMYAEQAFDMARMRAIEQRRYLVRASMSGPSAVVDPTGRILERTQTDSRATLNGAIEPRREVTFYARYGDVFGLLCVLIPLGFAAAAPSRARR
ncbi:MAG TPA: apolipoprotein N-acyltransferase [Candidatus Acidoferrales bacterium]|nr:apolipoprotein N-acyltransferase [Candidatus Acidoferrales bacterium]